MHGLNLHPLSEKFLDLDSESGEIKGRGGLSVGRPSRWCIPIRFPAFNSKLGARYVSVATKHHNREFFQLIAWSEDTSCGLQ